MRNPNSFGGISKLSGKRRNPYMVRITTGFDECGKQQYKIIGYYPNRKLAMQSLVEYHHNPNHFIASDLTFSDMYDRFCQFKWLRENKPIPAGYRSAYNKWCKPLYNIPFVQIRFMDLQDILDNCPLGYSAQNIIKSLLNMIYQFAIKNDIVSKNYGEMLTLPPIVKSEIHTPFTDKELKTLWNNSDNYGIRLWLILCYSGMRPSELLTIRTENIHLDESYMVGGVKNDFSKNRPIPLADCIKPFIKDMYDPNQEYLLIHKNKHMSNDVYRDILSQAISPLNISHLPHDGRHTCATKLHKIDNPPIKKLVIQKILGHTPVTITDRVYTHVDIEDMLDAVNRLPASF